MTVLSTILLAASNVVHVIVDAAPSPSLEPLYKQERFWVGLSAVVSASVAVATMLLARYTRALALETREAIRAEDRRFMETFQPHIAIECASENEHVLSLHNIGPGYARGIQVHFSHDPQAKVKMLAGPTALAAGEARIFGYLGWTETLEGLSVTYQDAFGRFYESNVPGTYFPGLPYEFVPPPDSLANQ